LSHFYDDQGGITASELDVYDKVALYSWQGMALQALGSLVGAIKPLKTVLEMHLTNNDMDHASTATSNLSILYLSLGKIAKAEEYVLQSIQFDAKQPAAHREIYCKVQLANVLHQKGDTKQAEQMFVEAESMLQKSQPELHRLYSGDGFLFAELLLAQGQVEEVMKRVQSTFEYGTSLLDRAFNQLTMAKALMYRQSMSKVDENANLEKYINQAVEGFRQASEQAHLVLALLTRAAIYRQQKSFRKAWLDLDECYEIVLFSQMKLHLADYHLEACRTIWAQFLDMQKNNKDSYDIKERQIDSITVLVDGKSLKLNDFDIKVHFKTHYDNAVIQINDSGYHRRDAELHELRGVI
jgi:tetratricopeptide (TPR) repeat protein